MIDRIEVGRMRVRVIELGVGRSVIGQSGHVERLALGIKHRVRVWLLIVVVVCVEMLLLVLGI